MPFACEELEPGTPPFFQDPTDNGWLPMCRHDCTFGPEIFLDIMMNLVKNPNLNSSWLFRADIIYDDHPDAKVQGHQTPEPPRREISDYTCQRTLVRNLVPRNSRRDAPLDQTCYFYQTCPEGSSIIKTIVLYTPQVDSVEMLPFYHPKAKGIAHLHEWDTASNSGSISLHLLPFTNPEEIDTKLRRISFHLLEILHKHGQGRVSGYVKRVHHDVIVPQPAFQDRYSDFKNKYAADLVTTWAETTDPTKHVFEDLGIASFLIELWKDMYRDTKFPGFVDIGCGNGLLVHLLRREGYEGWGFDARARKSWANYNSDSPLSPSGKSLERRLLLPSVIPGSVSDEGDARISSEDIHDGVFPKGTFIISNHADELTPWTPILATISECPFIMIPCCSHNLTGDKHRAPPPRDKTKGHSAFASLVEWVTNIGNDCGWEIETEMLRIPSTRNTGLVGRKRTKDASEIEIDAIVQKYGGVGGYFDNVIKLLKSAPRGH